MDPETVFLDQRLLETNDNHLSDWLTKAIEGDVRFLKNVSVIISDSLSNFDEHFYLLERFKVNVLILVFRTNTCNFDAVKRIVARNPCELVIEGNSDHPLELSHKDVLSCPVEKLRLDNVKVCHVVEDDAQPPSSLTHLIVGEPLPELTQEVLFSNLPRAIGVDITIPSLKVMLRAQNFLANLQELSFALRDSHATNPLDNFPGLMLSIPNTRKLFIEVIGFKHNPEYLHKMISFVADLPRLHTFCLTVNYDRIAEPLFVPRVHIPHTSRIERLKVKLVSCARYDVECAPIIDWASRLPRLTNFRFATLACGMRDRNAMIPVKGSFPSIRSAQFFLKNDMDRVDHVYAPLCFSPAVDVLLECPTLTTLKLMGCDHMLPVKRISAPLVKFYDYGDDTSFVNQALASMTYPGCLKMLDVFISETSTRRELRATTAALSRFENLTQLGIRCMSPVLNDREAVFYPHIVKLRHLRLVSLKIPRDSPDMRAMPLLLDQYPRMECLSMSTSSNGVPDEVLAHFVEKLQHHCGMRTVVLSTSNEDIVERVRRCINRNALIRYQAKRSLLNRLLEQYDDPSPCLRARPNHN